MAAQQPVNTTINLAHDDGYTSRISSDIPLEHWQRVARVVVDWQAKNLTTQIVTKALPYLVQNEQRALHAQMVGLLSADLVGVIVVKNNHNEITRPVGWSFFARVAAGRISPLHQLGAHHSPLKADVSPDMDFQSTHTRRTRDFSPQWGSV